MTPTLYYVHDPMCSWCYAFGPVLHHLQQALPQSLPMKRLLGGLAPDNSQPMGPEMRQGIEETWRRIEKSVPGTHFNYDFWKSSIPYRSTYPSCRAVIAATMQGVEYDLVMTKAIQRAYYQQARNPSETETLIEIAKEVGLNIEKFARELDSKQVEDTLHKQIALASSIGADSFPSLVLASGVHHWPIPIDYNDHTPMVDTLHFLLDESAQIKKT